MIVHMNIAKMITHDNQKMILLQNNTLLMPIPSISCFFKPCLHICIPQENVGTSWDLGLVITDNKNLGDINGLVMTKEANENENNMFSGI